MTDDAPLRTEVDTTTVSAEGAQPEDRADPAPRSWSQRLSRSWARLAAAGLVTAVSTVSMLRHDVSVLDFFKYATYLVVAVGLPGMVVSRLLIGRRATLVEDVAFSMATGFAAQILAWYVLRSIGLDALVPWWWMPVLLGSLSTSRLRELWSMRFDRSVSTGWAWAMAGVASNAVIAVEVEWIRTTPLPPRGGVAYVDTWWHLALVRELMRPGPAQLPQVAGEPLSYHVNSQVHIAISSVTSRVDPELVFLRLWIVPVALVGIVLLASLAQYVTGRSWSGPLCAWLVFGALSGGYLWTELRPVSVTPLRVLSPSQVFVLPLAFGVAWGFVRLLRREMPWPGWLWIGMLVVVGSRTKPTLVLIMLSGLLLAGLVTVLIERTIPWNTVLGAVSLVAVQAWSLTGGLEERGSSVTLFGTLKSLDIYRTITNDTTYRAVNDGFLLDSLTGSRAWIAAGATILWFVVVQLVHLVGLVAVTRRTLRRDPVTWFLAGSLISGVMVFFLLDHSAFSQVYFLHLSIAFGAVLTTVLFVDAVGMEPGKRAALLITGGGVVGLVALRVARGVAAALAERDGFGMLQRVAAPVIVVGALAGVAAVAAHRYGWLSGRNAVIVAAVAIVIGISVPTSIERTAVMATRWERTPTGAIDEDDRGYLSSGEVAAAVWLDEHSDEDDIVASNTQCRELTTNPRTCNAVGFWVSGIAGRRVVIEGWGYTAPAHAAHGEDGLHRNRTVPGWPERYALSIGAIEDPSAATIEGLRDDYGASWIFASRRAGPVSAEISEYAELAFDNGEVEIYRIPG